MKINLPSGTKAEVVHPPNGNPERGMVIIPDVMGLRPLFIDLANEHSCGFIATEDLGEVFENNNYSIIGRMTESEMRGCNQMFN